MLEINVDVLWKSRYGSNHKLKCRLLTTDRLLSKFLVV